MNTESLFLPVFHFFGRDSEFARFFVKRQSEAEQRVLAENADLNL
jgi:hypothetical protein